MALLNLCPCSYSSSVVPKSLASTTPSPSLPKVFSSPSHSIYSPFLHNSFSALVIQSQKSTPTRPISHNSKICCAINDNSNNWGNRPPKETILLPGCDYEHWLIVMEFPKDPKPSSEEMVDTYIKTLAKVVGSEEEAKKRIYALSTTTYTGFQAQISEELSEKCKGLPGVLWVLPDSYIDVPNKDYGGDKFVDGKVIPRPQPRPSQRQNQPRRNYNRQQTYQRQRYERRRDGPPLAQKTSVQVTEGENPEANQTNMVQNEGQ